ncbi:MAG: sodium:proton antiporter [Bacillaceae bacterium]|nr:sodium:proton antiporter [Bacillaceae bacterium]
MSFDKPLVIGFLPGFFSLVIIVKRKGVPFHDIWTICKKGITKTKTVVFILLLVSFVLPSWYLAGTITQLVSISLHIITPEYFYLFTFFIALIFSMVLGTSVGTLSAVGIPIMSSALAIDLSPEIVAGALISGAFVGDRTSPFSSAHQLLSHTVEIPGRKQLRAMSITTIMAIFIGIGYYGLLDYQKEIKAEYFIEFSWNELSIIQFLPPLILIAVVMMQKGIIYAFLASILTAGIIALVQGGNVSELFSVLVLGVDDMGGGLINMYLLLLFLALAGAYNGLLEEYQIIQPILDGWLEKSKTLVEDSLKTISATLGISLISANQTLPIILTGRTFIPHWSKKQSKHELARVMADSTMVFPGMIPWSVLAIMCSTIVGVPIISYLPYAIFLWILPLLTILVSAVKQLQQVKNESIKKNKTNIS